MRYIFNFQFSIFFILRVSISSFVDGYMKFAYDSDDDDDDDDDDYDLHSAWHSKR